jgi:hypothetical protein
MADGQAEVPHWPSAFGPGAYMTLVSVAERKRDPLTKAVSGSFEAKRPAAPWTKVYRWIACWKAGTELAFPRTGPDMHRFPTARHPKCHLAHLPAPGRAGAETAVWVCEYPYRTIRMSGPSADCSDCPVWRELQRSRHCGLAAEREDVDTTVTVDLDRVGVETRIH